MASRPPRYATSAGMEGEFEPGSRSRVLRNALGIRTKSGMDRAEYEALEDAQDRYLDLVTDETVMTAQFICGMHRAWLGGIYPWAGSYRTVELSKGGFTWPPASRVHDNMAQLEQAYLRKLTPMAARDLRDAAPDLAIVHAELLLIHPFREGNGRLARWLANLMCLQAGLPIPDFGFNQPGRGPSLQRRYLAAVIQGYQRDYRALTDVFRDALERSTEG